jgi:hypothetical protein
MINEVENLYQTLRSLGLASPTPKMKILFNPETRTIKIPLSQLNTHRISMIKANRMNA